jgi:hypothetical protein
MANMVSMSSPQHVVSFKFVSWAGRASVRGLFVGLGGGIGSGIAIERCNVSFKALQKTGKPAVTKSQDA